jgi:dTDP-4-amino-4,6-dideoxygalactose transaminase
LATPPPILPADPRANYLAHKEEIDAALRRVLEGGQYILGDEVAAFEQEFARFVGVRHCAGVASGTDALQLALRAVGVGPGDVVLTVSHTAVATVAAIELAGATPVLADIGPDVFTIDPDSLEAAVGRLRGGPPAQAGRLKAVIVVHLYGQPADMPALLAVAERHGLQVIEDCAQAVGSILHERKAGAWGRAAAFSFYPTKNLGALGDGGAVVTDDPEVADRVRLLREYGWRARYVSDVPGLNSRLDALQAAILRVKLRHLDCENERRRDFARLYSSLLSGTGLRLPREAPGALCSYHQYVVRASRRDELREYLGSRGIGSLVHYPVPVHLQPAYRNRLPDAVPLCRTEQVCREILSLPMYPELGEERVRAVAGHLVASGLVPPLED